MSLGSVRRQKTKQLEFPQMERGEASKCLRSGETPTAANGDVRSGSDQLMEEVVERSNALAALKRVRQNKGSPGIDGMEVKELPKYLKENWEQIRAQLLDGSYQPKPIKRQQIPKSGGGIRELGIPCAVDRFIQQAILQVLQPRFDPTFSEHSYGCRPGRSAHQAVCAAQRYILEGGRWVVDLDLEKFFDRVNHDVMMGKLSKRILDKRMLRIIRRYLEADVMVQGIASERHEGMPQGGPLSPLLANVLLDEVDKELEKRGHSFCRYVDDLNVYVRSKRAGQDVMRTLRRQYARLRLRVNESKSAVADPEERKFLGYSFWTWDGAARRRIAPEALAKLKERVRQITSRNGGRSLKQVVAGLREYLPGWKNYFRLVDTPSIFRKLDGWIRRRLRMLVLHQWKRGPTTFRKLRAMGLPQRTAAEVAAQSGRWWGAAAHAGVQIALSISYFDAIGVPRLAN